MGSRVSSQTGKKQGDCSLTFPKQHYLFQVHGFYLRIVVANKTPRGNTIKIDKR
jgi:hypothetical protein